MSEEKILVVEDEPSIGEVVSLYLRRAGYQVTWVQNGLDALEVFLDRGPDLVVLDLMLPQVDGFEITRWIRDRGDTPIIMLTARREEADRIAGLEMGADDYVVKPFSPQELVSRVRAVLRRSQRAPPTGRSAARRIWRPLHRSASATGHGRWQRRQSDRQRVRPALGDGPPSPPGL